MQTDIINNTTAMDARIAEVDFKVVDLDLRAQQALRHHPRSRTPREVKNRGIPIFAKENLPQLLVLSGLFNDDEIELLSEGRHVARYTGPLRKVLESFYEEKGYERGLNTVWKVRDRGQLDEFIASAGGVRNFEVYRVGEGEPRYRLNLREDPSGVIMLD